MGTPNGYEDGHQALEVKIGGNWVLHDISNKTRFTDGSGNLLSADAAVSALAASTAVYDPLGIGGCAIELQSGPFDATAYCEATLLNQADLLAWHSRIFQAIGIVNGSQVWWKLPAGAPSVAAAWVQGLQPNYVVKDATTWNAAFY